MFICLCGKSKAGKTTVAEYIRDKYGFQHIELSSIIEEELERRGIEKTKMNMSIEGDRMRKEHGMDVLARMAMERWRGGNTVISTVRSREEWEFIKSRGMAFLVMIDAPEELRMERGAEPDRDERDERNKGMSLLYERADFVIWNDSTPEELYRRIDEVMERIMSVAEYDRMGFVAGIEIHQRLDTGKLFCRCSGRQESKEAGAVERELRFSRGEEGRVDEAALFEHSRRKRFTYYLYPGETCLVEMDEEPPRMPDEQALSIAAGIAKALNCRLLPDIQFMRKIIVDGSNVTGFQRTAVIGIDGWIETSLGKVGIESIAVEEESARPYRDGYRLNSLGIPLVEISTSPDIKSPGHAREVAWKIGLVLRSFPVQRGIGSIRQDVNVSVREGTRVEIKGFQYLDDIPEVIEAEVERQKDMARLAERLRGMDISGVEDVTPFFSQSRSRISRGKKAFAFHIPNGKGLFLEKAGRVRLGKEVAGYVRPFGLKGIIHSDEDVEKYGLAKEFGELAREKGWNGLIVVAFGDNAGRALSFLRQRLLSLAKGPVPETRGVADKPLRTVFLRPLGTSARMYPETDIPLLKLPEPFEARLLTGIMDELEREVGDYARQLVRSDYLDIYLEYRDRIEKRFLASLLTSKITELRRDGMEVPEEGKIRELLDLMLQGRLTRRGVIESLRDDWRKHERISGRELEELCRKMDFRKLMRKYGTRVDAEEARRIYGRLGKG